jgi:hypothetical protein
VPLHPASIAAAQAAVVAAKTAGKESKIASRESFMDELPETCMFWDNCFKFRKLSRVNLMAVDVRVGSKPGML